MNHFFRLLTTRLTPFRPVMGAPLLFFSFFPGAFGLTAAPKDPSVALSLRAPVSYGSLAYEKIQSPDFQSGFGLALSLFAGGHQQWEFRLRNDIFQGGLMDENSNHRWLANTTALGMYYLGGVGSSRTVQWGPGIFGQARFTRFEGTLNGRGYSEHRIHWDPGPGLRLKANLPNGTYLGLSLAGTFLQVYQLTGAWEVGYQF